ncbi:hypothetical protein N7474_010475 [Penicillium riverlandense]|uniref:uncharacterized protein n=1 Tax=Penicillium riverlandense TaxID=1903569 RepID=UPI00254991B3|nr:uncharacterized protein N7474_010475 [Penicillium riverlandense]KAJ5806883.1 hypothetical protein N7474_010475 [Penicillium riverlandense]
MPAIPSPTELLENILVHRNTDPTSNNTTAPVLEVVCAWPVSGQYGPGTRVLYYTLMVACVIARKEEYIRNSCLAAALLFPAVAAIHGIVLAAVHRDGAVDMDVYGAFQLCAIGILTAPVTVRLSKTYFNNPGRDIIFLWTGLLLAGLLSLTVEFIRLAPTQCPPDNSATKEWILTGQFPYKSKCGMICGDKGGPVSPLRKYSADNIYVIPMPHEITFSTATLLAAACCIPAILSLVSTWIKILEKNWEKLARGDRQTENSDEQPIKGTNGATPVQMSGIAKRLRGWLTLIEIPVFAVAVLAILVKGEMNFWSEPVKYQTEPIASVGQWAPIVGTALAAIGSLYLLLAADMEAEKKGEMPPDEEPKNQPVGRCARCDQCAISSDNADSSTGSRHSSQSSDERLSQGVARTETQPSISTAKRTMTSKSEGSDPAGRRKVARFLNMASMRVAAKAGSQFKDSGFNPQGGEGLHQLSDSSVQSQQLCRKYSIQFIQRPRKFEHALGSFEVSIITRPSTHTDPPKALKYVAINRELIRAR